MLFKRIAVGVHAILMMNLECWTPIFVVSLLLTEVSLDTQNDFLP